MLHVRENTYPKSFIACNKSKIDTILILMHLMRISTKMLRPKTLEIQNKNVRL
jgi:hypothetical protein